MERPAFAKPFTVLEKNKLIAYLIGASLIGGPVLFAAFLAQLFPPGLMGIHLGIFGLVMWVANQRLNFRAKRKPSNVRADQEGVWQDGKLVVPRAKIADGFFQPRIIRDPNKASSYGSSVRLVDRRRRVLFEAEAEEDEALQMLHALGLDPGSKRAVFRGSSPLYATLAANLLFVFGSILTSVLLTFALSALFGLVAPFTVFFMLPVLFIGMWPSKIEVGVDGILVRWMWRKKFIPMSQVMSVQREGDRAIRIYLTGGKVETIHTSMRKRNSWGTAAFSVQHNDAVFARINEALAAFHARGPAADVSALVGKGTRTRTEWLTALGKLRNEGGYREAVVRDEDLWRVVEDPSAPEDARGGAAMLLRQSLDDAGRARVRVAAEATASPKLRVALDAVADATEDRAMQEALEELAGEDTRSSGEKGSARRDA